MVLCLAAAAGPHPAEEHGEEEERNSGEPEDGADYAHYHHPDSER